MSTQTDQASFDRFSRFLGWFMQRVFLPGLIGAVVLGFVAMKLSGRPETQRVLARLAFDGGGLLLASWLGFVGAGCLWLALRRARGPSLERRWVTAARTFFLVVFGLGLVLLGAGFARASLRQLWALLA